MRATKYIVVIAAVVAILVAAVWYLRNTLIQQISNPLLQDLGIVVTDVSLDAMATRDASIGHIVLEHKSGTTIVIEDLTLPIRRENTGSRNYAAGKVLISTSSRRDGEPFELALLIDQLLSLASKLGDTELAIAEFNLPPYPAVHDLQWVLRENDQHLSANTESIALRAAITRTASIDHTVVVSIPDRSAATPGRSITASIEQSGQGISLKGSSSLDLPAWEPLAKLAGVVPHPIEVRSGTAELQLSIEVPYNTDQSTTVTAELTPSTPLRLTYSEKPDEITFVVVEASSPVVIAAQFPESEWSLQQAQASLLVAYGDWLDIPLSVRNLACESGPVCSMNTHIVMGAAELPFGKVGRIEFSSEQKLRFLDEGLRIDVQPKASFEVTGLSTPDTDVKRFSAQLISAAALQLEGAGWRIAADSVDANIEAVSLSENLSVTAPLFFENLIMGESDQLQFATSGVYSPSGQATMEEQTISLPGFKGGISLQGAELAVDLQSVGLHKNGTIKAKHNLDTRAGQLTIGDTAVSFGTQPLSSRVSPWNEDWDLAAGTVLVDLHARWTQTDSNLVINGQTSTRIENLSGHYLDTAFVGLSTTFETAYDSPSGFTVEPSSFTIALIDTGLSIEKISAGYTVYPDALAFDMENLQMEAYGGVIRADPFSFRTDGDSNTVLLRAEAIELDALLTLKEFEAIEVSGSIGAKLPVTIQGDIITIENGTLTGEPPGGVIRYSPGLNPDAADTSSIGLVTRALSNFEYETLTAEVDYNTDGDLDLQLHLTGKNPDLDENRPVVLNLGVENNVPEMLKSLRAARAVEDVLEERLNK